MSSIKSSLDLSHYSVMLNEVIKISTPSKGGTYIDCTFGGGGYSKQLLKFSKTQTDPVTIHSLIGMYFYFQMHLT